MAVILEERGRGKFKPAPDYKVDEVKELLNAKIEGLRIDKKVEGISEVRDETDRTGIRIAIDLKANANKDVIMRYYLKNTD